MRANRGWTSKGIYIAGDWQHLPFADDTFTGLLSYESFPRHLTTGVVETIAEITRVAKQGALWRATVDENFFENEELFRKTMLEKGWEIFYHQNLYPHVFIAQLKDKQPK